MGSCMVVPTRSGFSVDSQELEDKNVCLGCLVARPKRQMLRVADEEVLWTLYSYELGFYSGEEVSCLSRSFSRLHHALFKPDNHGS